MTKQQLSLLDFTAPPEPVPAKQLRDSWGQVIQYLEGYAWGIGDSGETVCLGREAAVKEAITSDKKSYSGFPDIDAIIELEKSLIAKEGETDGRKPELQKPGNFRSRIVGMAKHRTANIRSAPARKRLPIHKA